MCCRMTTLDERPVAGPMLIWLDALEKDFDKAFVDLDLLLGEIDSDQVIDLLFSILFFSCRSFSANFTD